MYKSFFILIFLLVFPLYSYAFQVDVVLQLKEPYNQNSNETLSILAQQALQLFGTGGNPQASKVEEFLGYVNTPVYGNYITVRVNDTYAKVLEQIQENEMVKLIRVQWPDKTPEDGWEPIYYSNQCTDINNQPYQCLQQIGIIN